MTAAPPVSSEAAKPGGVVAQSGTSAGAPPAAAAAAQLAVATPTVPAPSAPPAATPVAVAAAPSPPQVVAAAAPAPSPTPAVGPKPAVAQDRPNTAQFQPRHMALVVSFVVMVLIPTLLTAAYLWLKAADQYASSVSFSVRQEQTSSAISILGAIPSFSGSSSADTDIIYDYVGSQQLVADAETELGVSKIWSKPADDFVYAYDTDGTIEDLTDYWHDMVKVYYDSVTRLIEVRVLAFDPDDAQRISAFIFERSTDLVNELNDVSRADALRYASEELADTERKLTIARQAMTTFRLENQIIDPASVVAGQSAVLQQLEQELVRTQIELGVLDEAGVPGDPRRPALETRITVIEGKMKSERQKLGVGESGVPGTAMVAVVSGYEKVAADLQFAEGAYHAARAAYDVAQAESRRRTRYLAAHVLPTRAESARFPERGVTLVVISVFLLLTWSILSLVYYAVRDRR